MAGRFKADYAEWGEALKLRVKKVRVGKRWGSLRTLAQAMGRDYTTLLRWMHQEPHDGRLAEVEGGLERLQSGAAVPLETVNRAVNKVSEAGEGYMTSPPDSMSPEEKSADDILRLNTIAKHYIADGRGTMGAAYLHAARVLSEMLEGESRRAGGGDTSG